MSILTATELSITIGERQVCSQLDFCIEPGQCWGLLGRNGSGKTTLLHTLARLHSADTGHIELEHSDLGQLSRKQIAKKQGLLFQQTDSPFPITVMDTVLAGRHPYLGLLEWSKKSDIELANQALADVHLSHLANRTLDTLSGGERQRVNIASLLTQTPALYLLDEPCNHLDLDQQIRILELFKKQCDAGHAVLMSLHDVNLARRFCDHLILIDSEDTLAGPTATTGTAEQLAKLYGHPLLAVKGPERDILVPS